MIRHAWVLENRVDQQAVSAVKYKIYREFFKKLTDENVQESFARQNGLKQFFKILRNDIIFRSGLGWFTAFFLKEEVSHNQTCKFQLLQSISLKVVLDFLWSWFPNSLSNGIDKWMPDGDEISHLWEMNNKNQYSIQSLTGSRSVIKSKESISQGGEGFKRSAWCQAGCYCGKAIQSLSSGKKWSITGHWGTSLPIPKKRG